MTFEGRQILSRVETRIACEFAIAVARQAAPDPPDSKAPFEAFCWLEAWNSVFKLKGGKPVQVEFHTRG